MPTLDRYWFLNQYRSLDDKSTREERWKKDRFAANRDMFEWWNDNCGSALQMNEYVTIDECQYATSMRVGFKTYNPLKSAKYGLLYKCFNEVIKPLTHRSDAFAGKPSEEDGE